MRSHRRGPASGVRRRDIRRAFVLAVCTGAILGSGAAGAVTLQQAVQQAITTNPKISRADADRRAASRDVREARAGYLPSVDITGGGGGEHSNISANRPAAITLGVRQFALTVRQMLYDGKATTSEVDRRVALLDAAAGQAADARESVAFRAVQAFMDVLKSRRLVKLAVDNVASHRDTLHKVRLKVNRGVASAADVDQAESRLALAQSTLTAREGALRRAVATYRRVVGDYPSNLVEPAAQKIDVVRNAVIDKVALRKAIETATATALKDNPSLHAAQAQVRAADAAVTHAHSTYYPRLDIEASAARDSNQSGIEGISNTESIMVVGRWNLYRGGGDMAREQASAERRVAAMDAAADTRRSIEENVAIAVQAKATSQARLVHLKEHVDSSAKTLRAYEAQFNLGRRSLLNLLDAKNELFQARSDYAVGHYDDLVNQYFIEASKGVLVKSLGISTQEAKAEQ